MLSSIQEGTFNRFYPKHLHLYKIKWSQWTIKYSLSLSLSLSKKQALYTSGPLSLGFSPWGNSLHQLLYPQYLSLQLEHQLFVLNLSISLGQWFHNGSELRMTEWFVNGVNHLYISEDSRCKRKQYPWVGRIFKLF